MGMDIRVLDSLQKVFADEELPAGGTAGVTALRGERVNFQVACRSTQVARMLVAARAQLPFSGEAICTTWDRRGGAPLLWPGGRAVS